MAKYKKVLLAVDFGADNSVLIDKARHITSENNAELLLIHAHEPVINAYNAGGMAVMDAQVFSLDEELQKISKKRLQDLASEMGVPAKNCFLPFGKASTEIKRCAEENDIDLIVIGTHGRHGIGLILGSTANAVLHGVPCDVLAVRMHNS